MNPSSSGFSRRAWWATGGIIVLLLLPSLLHPLGADQALFFVIGQKIRSGAMLYRDVVDIKPPLIYHLYALAQILFGDGALSIRIFDVLAQGVTCWLMIDTIRRARGGDAMAALAPICYLLLYFAQGSQYTAQSEGFAGLFAMLMIRQLLFSRTARGFALAGVLAGALFLLKFTFGAMLAVAILGEIILYRNPPRRLVRHLLPMLAGFGAVVAVMVVYLAAGGALHAFSLISAFTGEYAKIELRNPAQWFRNLITLPTLHFADNYSIALLLATAAGFARSLRPMGRAGTDDGSIERTRLLRYAALAFLAMFATIVIEAKYPAYHFMRLYPFGALLASAGITGVVRLARNRYIVERYSWIAMPALLAVTLLFGPFIRYGWHAILPARETIERPGRKGPFVLEPYSYETFDVLGDIIQRVMNEGDKLFVMSSQAALVYHHAETPPELGVLHSAFVIAPFAPQEWRDSTRAYLLRERPAVIVLDEGDDLPGITGTHGTSATAVRALPGVAAMIDADYERYTFIEVPSYAVYRRKEGTR